MGNTSRLGNQVSSLLPRIAPAVTVAAETATCRGWETCTRSVCHFAGGATHSKIISCYNCGGYTSCYSASGVCC